jgi:MFS family permease
MPLPATLDRRFWLLAALGSLGSLLLLGIPTALIPNPVFGRQIEAEPFAYAVWLASAVLMGLVAATYLAPAPGARSEPHADERATGGLTIGGLAAFLAVGCPVCNKIAVVALGFTGALQYFAPIQPILGAASVALLAVTLAWRLRARTRPCARCASIVAA